MERLQKFPNRKEACRQIHPQRTLAFQSRCRRAGFPILTRNPERFLEPLIRSWLILWEGCKNVFHFISQLFLINILMTKIVIFCAACH